MDAIARDGGFFREFLPPMTAAQISRLKAYS